VSRKLVEVGQLVQAGQTLMSIVSDSGVFITANFKETQLARIRVGQKVDSVDARTAVMPKARWRHRVGHRREVRAAAAGQRDRQLHQSCAARSGAYQGHQGTWLEKPLRPGMSVLANVMIVP
jgi:membrane fusion protein (multidrug efflux system)